MQADRLCRAALGRQDDFADGAPRFHHFVRTVPGDGLIVMPDDSDTLDAVISKGCWTAQKTFALQNADEEKRGDWNAELLSADGSHFNVWMFDEGEYKKVATVQWSLTGNHSVSNALAAMAAARHVGVTPEVTGPERFHAGPGAVAGIPVVRGGKGVAHRVRALASSATLTA